MSNTKIPATAQNVPVPVATDLEKTRDLQIAVDLDPIATLQAEKAVLEARLLKMELSTQPYIRRALTALASRLWWLGKKLPIVVAGLACLMGVVVVLYQQFVTIRHLEEKNREYAEKLGGMSGPIMISPLPPRSSPDVVVGDEAAPPKAAPVPKPDTTKVVAPKAKPPAVSNGEMLCKEGEVNCNIPPTTTTSTDAPPSAADKSAPKADKKVDGQEYTLTGEDVRRGLIATAKHYKCKGGFGTLLKLNNGRTVTPAEGSPREIKCTDTDSTCLNTLRVGETYILPFKCPGLTTPADDKE
jgi:hypothetical protein